MHGHPYATNSSKFGAVIGCLIVDNIEAIISAELPSLVIFYDVRDNLVKSNITLTPHIPSLSLRKSV